MFATRLLKRSIAALAVLLASVALAACSASPTATPTPSQPTPTPTPPLTKVRLALDWTPNADHAGLYIAKQEGFFAAQGLDVDIYVPNDPSTVLQTVGAGQDDFGVSYESDVLLAAQHDVPVVSIAALVQHPLNSVMALQSSGITRPRDLKGKKVGSAGLPSDAAFLATMLQADGLTLNDVTMVNVGYDLVPALISKQVDAIVGAYWTHESISAENQGYPVNIMRVEQWGVPDYYELVLVANADKVQSNPDLVQRFINAVVKGYDEAIADPQKAIDILKQAAPEIDESIERPGVAKLAPLWAENGQPFGTQTAAKWNSFATWMEDQKLLGNPGDVSRLWTNQFVAGAK